MIPKIREELQKIHEAAKQLGIKNIVEDIDFLINTNVDDRVKFLLNKENYIKYPNRVLDVASFVNMKEDTEIIKALGKNADLLRDAAATVYGDRLFPQRNISEVAGILEVSFKQILSKEAKLAKELQEQLAQEQQSARSNNL